MGSAVSFTNPKDGVPSRRASSTRSSHRNSAPSSSLPRSARSPHRSSLNRTPGHTGDSEMLPLTRHLSSSASSSSSISQHGASFMATASAAQSSAMSAAFQRVRSVTDSGYRFYGVDSAATADTQAGRQDAGPRPLFATASVEEGLPLVEELVAMASALVKPYDTICQRIRTQTLNRSPLGSRRVDSLMRAAVVNGEADGDAIARADLAAVAPAMQPLYWPDPPPHSPPSLGMTYPVHWYPSITPCFDEGLLYRIEWKRHGKTPLPGETADYAFVVWCFYNSTACYDMEIEVTFETPAACVTMPLRAWGETKLSWADGPVPTTTTTASTAGPGAAFPTGPSPPRQHRSLTARTVCPPLSTVGFITGRAGAFRTSIRGNPVTPGAINSLSGPASAAQLDDAHRGLSSEAALQLALRDNRLFIDPEFPPGDAALNGKGGLGVVPAAVSWLRAGDVVKRVVGAVPSSLTHVYIFASPDVGPQHIDPGELGDSWLVGAIAAAAEHFTNLVRLLVHPQSPTHSSAERALGAYRVTFNVHGWWQCLLVDDFLPVTPGNYLKYAHSSRDVREVWVSVVEKAFAKLRGGYANIVSGDPLDALRVFTGWPCARYALSNFKDIAVASSAFASRLMRYDRHGLQIVFHTAPSLASASAKRAARQRGSSVGVASLPDSSLCPEDDGGVAGGGGGGLAPGMVYAVLKILQFSTTPFRPELTLLKVRNVWGDVSAWNGRWRCGSPRWEQWPKVAETCQMPVHPVHQSEEEADVLGDEEASRTSLSSPCTCRREQYIWLEWCEVCRYFSGCGVVFRLANHHDYRVRGVFDGAWPSVCLRITVTSRSFVGITLSTHDATAEETPKMCDGGAASAQPPIMITLARECANVLHVLRNSQVDPDNPTSMFTFMQVSDVSLLSLLSPDDSPYWIIPRILPSPPSTSSTNTAPAAAHRPYVLGYFHKGAVGGKNGPRVEFVQLPPTSPAFQNHTRIPLGDDVASVKAKFQVKTPRAEFPRTYVYTEVSEEKGTLLNDSLDVVV